MAQMNYPHVPDNANAGERVVFNALYHHLPHEYYVWYEPTLFGNKKSARPDFVALGSDIGLVIVEVKDWSIDKIHAANRDKFEIFMGSSLATRTNPEQQAEYQSRALKDELDRYRHTDPENYNKLLRKEGKHKGKLAFSISALVVFPNITRKDWLSSDLELHKMCNEEFIILKDDLNNEIVERFRKTCLFHTNLTHLQLDTLKWMLYPQTRVPWSQGRLHTLSPDQVGIARIDTFLPPQAQEMSRKPQAKLVRGVVGSGKTLILLFRARFICEQNPDWKILVLTYNKSLSQYLRQIYRQIDDNNNRNIEIVNFHKWCRDILTRHGLFRSPQNENSQIGLINNILREVNVTEFDPQFLVDEFNWIKERIDYRQWSDYPDPQKIKRVGRERGLGRDEQQKRLLIYSIFCKYQERMAHNKMCDWADIPVMVLQAIEEGIIEDKQYHALLIDEAQDFAPTWFRTAFKMVKPETNFVFIVGDGAQKIYRRDFTWKELGLGITAQNSYILRHSYRSTREIIEVALEVIRDSKTLVTELEDAGDSMVEPDKDYAEFRHGPIPMLFSFESLEQECNSIAGEILSLLQQGYLPKDIAILRRHWAGQEKVAQELKKHGIPCKVIKGDLDITEPTVKICTFHSIKGLEFEIVFISGLEEFHVNEQIDAQGEDSQQLIDQQRKLLYVGMTRARQLLYITSGGTGADWLADRLRHKIEEMQPK